MGRAGWIACLLATACYGGRSAGPDGGGAEGTDGGGSDGGDGGDDGVVACADADAVIAAGPVRRLTRFEYNNTVRDLLGDDTLPANAFPSEEIGNGFGNDASAQSVSSLLAEQYAVVAEDIATRATETPEALASLAPCAADVTADTETACVTGFLESFLPRAYRRPLEAGELVDLLELQESVRSTSTFADSIAAVIEAVLQSPDFLYRVEWGVTDEDGRRRPTGHEMASRLSYFLWSSMPDDELLAAAESGDLTTNDGVLAQAERMLADARARPMVRHFFDNLLPISGLSGLERDPALFPSFTPAIGVAMREEAHQLVQHEIFEGSGTWPGVLTAPYTFVDADLAAFYGIEGVVGSDYQKVDLDPTRRLGLLTQAGVVAGTIHSNLTNPVTRGSFLVQKVMCIPIPLPDGAILAEIKPPDPDSGKTARERYSAHSEDPVCAGCHLMMDPVGLALENYDPVGLWRDTENGVTIDASGTLPGFDGEFGGPIDLVEAIAADERTHACFAQHWASFAYGRTQGEEHECLQAAIEERFIESGYDVEQLLLTLTQTDDFLFLPSEEGA